VWTAGGGVGRSLGMAAVTKASLGLPRTARRRTRLCRRCPGCCRTRRRRCCEGWCSCCRRRGAADCPKRRACREREGGEGQTRFKPGRARSGHKQHAAPWHHVRCSISVVSTAATHAEVRWQSITQKTTAGPGSAAAGLQRGLRREAGARAPEGAAWHAVVGNSRLSPVRWMRGFQAEGYYHAVPWGKLLQDLKAGG
jgi:hypothetical protein